MSNWPVQQTFNYTGTWTTFNFNSAFSGLSSLTWQVGWARRRKPAR
ncbi:hypothetical protein FHW83_005047 [Duganella sp. SG902]|nr:hypothetical protein [Duganella sp. SG902]NVM79210.1 hypothetical protein [Duganella sp. SG902]